MKAVIQRVTRGKVTIEGHVHGEIGRGFVILLGVAREDTREDMDYLVKKISGLRIFEDSEGKMNLSLRDVKGELLVISQFTLFANTRKGNRPSFIDAAFLKHPKPFIWTLFRPSGTWTLKSKKANLAPTWLWSLSMTAR